MPKLSEEKIRKQFDGLRKTTRREVDEEIDKAKTTLEVANRREEAKEETAREQLKDFGVSVEKLEQEEEREAKETAEQIKKRREELIDGRPTLAEDLEHQALEKALAPEAEATRASLVGRELYASDAQFLSDIEGDVGNPYAVPWDPHTANPYCWAQGAGWWSSAEITIYSTFWYYFYPWANRHFTVVPHVNFHGFYILRANDKWWNSKYAKVESDVRVRAYQYNWKSQAVHSVINQGDDNIDLNTRFDDSRHFYYSFLAGAEDLAWIRVMVRLRAYARGSGSYAELNFASGSANYLQVPHVHVY